MTSLRSWSRIFLGLVVAATVGLQACSTSEPEPPARTPRPPNAATPARPPETPGAHRVSDEIELEIEAVPDEGLVPLTVQFKPIVEGATGAITCDWNFGDGTPKSSDLEPSHVFQGVNDFIVTLRCKDSQGRTGETELDILTYRE